MAYVGTPIDTQNQFQSLQGKRFSGDGSTTAFTLDIAPSSVFDIEVFVENVRQDPNSAYGISGTTLTFTGAPPSGTNNIYVVHQAKAVGTIDVPASGVVPASLASNIISGQTALTSAPDDTDELLISDAGTIKRIDVSLIKSTNTPAFRAGLSSAQTISNSSHTVIVFDSEQFDTDSAYDNSNGKFTVPSGEAGKYFFYAHFRFQQAAVFHTAIEIHKNGSQVVHIEAQNNGDYPSCQASYICDLSAGDYIQATAYHVRGSDTDLTGNINYTAFGGFKLA